MPNPPSSPLAEPFGSDVRLGQNRAFKLRWTGRADRADAQDLG